MKNWNSKFLLFIFALIAFAISPISLHAEEDSYSIDDDYIKKVLNKSGQQVEAEKREKKHYKPNRFGELSVSEKIKAEKEAEARGEQAAHTLPKTEEQVMDRVGSVIERAKQGKRLSNKKPVAKKLKPKKSIEENKKSKTTP